jgi:hypothetical protein
MIGAQQIVRPWGRLRKNGNGPRERENVPEFAGKCNLMQPGSGPFHVPQAS